MVIRRREPGKRVAPLSRLKIREQAVSFRDRAGLTSPYIKVVALLEVLQEFEILEYEVVEDHILGEEEAVSYPDQGFMRIKESVYDKAFDGDGHCRFTIAHELGHMVMHRGQSNYARGSNGTHKVFEDSEWQADTFASELLIDGRAIPENADEYDISEIFGVSHKAARYRLQKDAETKKKGA